MKKLICLILVLCVIPIVALSDADLSSLSFDDLLLLRSEVEKELMSRPEWKEVIVPSGTWVVGVDIPVGLYSISPTEDGGYLDVMDKEGYHVYFGGIREESDTFGKVELKEGYTVEISDGSVIFAPPKSLGF